MSIGFGILKSVLNTQAPFSDILEAGIDDTYFEGAEQAAYEFIKTFRYKHGKYPEVKTVEVEIPGARFKELPVEPVEYWAALLRERKQYWILTKADQDFSECIRNNDVKAGVEKLKQYHEQILLTDQAFSLKNLADVQEEVLDKHDKVQRTAGISGIPYGYHNLDQLTYGQQPGDFNVLIGQTGVCKSYFSLFTALHGFNTGHDIIFISPEMPETQSARRLLAMQMQWRDQDIRKGKLSYFAVKKARQRIKEPISIEGEQQNNYFKILPSGLYSDVNAITAVCSEYKPDLLVVDGFYLLKNKNIRSNSSWAEDESVIFILKNFAVHSQIPILASTQYNRQKPGKLEGARGTQSVEQVASNFFSLEFENPEDRETNRPIQSRLLKTKKSREGDTMTIKFELDFNKTTIKELAVLSGPLLYEDSQPEFEDEEYISEV